MRDFIIDIALPTIGYFVGVFLCIGSIVFAAAIATNLIDDPVEMALFQDDAQ